MSASQLTVWKLEAPSYSIAVTRQINKATLVELGHFETFQPQ